MPCEIEVTDEFDAWFEDLTSEEQVDVIASIDLLQERGTQLPYPHSSGVAQSRHGHMRELRIQHHGRPYRVLYAFDPRRVVIILLGGCKAGDDRWYDSNVPIADQLYEEHLLQLRAEGLIE